MAWQSQHEDRSNEVSIRVQSAGALAMRQVRSESLVVPGPS